MALTALVSFAIVGFAVILTVNANVLYIEDQDTAMQKEPAKRAHNGSSGTWHCKNSCSPQGHCSRGYRCYHYYGCCKWVPCKKRGAWCRLQVNCCVQGNECKPVGRYWGKCVEESGSGLGEN